MGKSAAGVVVGISFMGIVLAAIEKGLYDNGVGANFLTAINVTVTEVMVITIVVFILVGVIVGILSG